MKQSKHDINMCRKNKNGLITRIYGHQKETSQRRKHEQPTYSKADFTEWIMSQEAFHILYSIWKESGFKRHLVPSVDRINDDKGYTLENIQLMTWEANRKKAERDIKQGKLRTNHTPVDQLSLDGAFMQAFPSIAQASRETGAHPVSVCQVCTGTRKTAGGYKWKYKESN